ncbi:MAG TPA: hypothetical protein VGK09_05055 [Rhodocyclaceae bacterium]|jgi:hypothetical protein
MMISLHKTARLMTIAALALLAGACSPISQDNYGKLKVGMSYDEVVAVIGKPSQCSEVLGARSCLWGDDNSNISVNFIAGQSVLYSSKNIH